MSEETVPVGPEEVEDKQLRRVNDIHKFYTFDREDPNCFLGKGAWGVVYRAKSVAVNDNTEYALKEIPISSVGDTEGEIAVLKLIRHPHVVHLYEVVADSTNMYVVMELCAGGPLFEYIRAKGKIYEDEVKDIARQLLQTLQYLHQRWHVAHLDLKPDNILVSNKDGKPHVKLIDFGLAHYFGKTSLQQELEEAQGSSDDFCRYQSLSRSDSIIDTPVCGTLLYCSPESLKARQQFLEEECTWSTERGTMQKCDIFAVGVILYFLLSGQMPWGGYDPRTGEPEKLDGPELQRLMSMPPAFPVAKWRNYKVAKQVVGKLLEKKPAQRPSASEALTHEWFAEPEPTPPATTGNLSAPAEPTSPCSPCPDNVSFASLGEMTAALCTAASVDWGKQGQSAP